MAKEVLAFSAAASTITYLGVVITGLSDSDSAIQFEPSVDSATMRVGIQGDAGIALSADSSAMFTLELLQGSESCEFLQNKLNAQKIGAIATGPLIYRDAVSGTQIILNRAFISRQPNITRGGEYGVMTWTFLAPDAVFSVKAETI
jgi:hypothetical protein